MNSIRIQEQSIYKQLQPVFETHGYEALPTKNQFRKKTKKGSRSVLFSVSGEAHRQILDLHLGIRFDIIETLVQQFYSGPKLFENESNTIVASLHKLKNAPIQRFTITDNESLQRACSEISVFMKEKGFRFLSAFDRLKRADATINRNPHLPCPYLHNQINRCFKGIVFARLLHRNDFGTLNTIYRNYLYSQRAPAPIMENYNKLVNYLKCFSFN